MTPYHERLLKRGAAFLRRLDDEDGAELLEFIGVIPLILFAALFVWQFMLMGYAAYNASSAAREGARALAVRGDCQAAAANSSWNWDSSKRRINCSVQGRQAVVTVELEVFRTELPLVGYLPSYPWVSSTATARLEPQPN